MAKVEVNIKKNLPDSELYEEVEYIEGTGTQWINLGKEIDYDTIRTYCKFKLTEVPSSGAKMVYLIKAKRTNNKVYMDYAGFDFGNDRNLFVQIDGLVAYSYYWLYDWYPNHTYTTSETIEIYHNQKELYVQTNSSNKIELTPSEGEVDDRCIPFGQETNDIGIFASQHTISDYNPIKMKLYSFKFGKSDSWVADLVPCVRKLDQVAGLYDKIRNKFYTNSGTGEFVVGNKTGQILGNDIFTVDQYNGLKSIKSLSQSTGQPKDIFYGITSSSGSIEISDSKNEFAAMITDGLIANAGSETSIVVNDNIVQLHTLTDSDYSTLNQKLNLQLSNKLDQWDKEIYSGYVYKGSSQTAYSLLTQVLKSFGFSESSEIPLMLSDVADTLQNITIARPFLTKGTYRETINKFCQLAQMQVYQADDGTIKFVSARPLIDYQNVIEIPMSKQLSQLKASLILKNKYDAVDIVPTVLKIENDVSVQQESLTPINGALPNSVLNQFRNNALTKKTVIGAFYEFPSGGIRSAARIESYYLQDSVNIPKPSGESAEQILDFNFSVQMSGNRYTVFTWNDLGNSANWESVNVDNNTLYSSASLPEQDSTWSGSKVAEVLEAYYHKSIGDNTKQYKLSVSTEPKFSVIDNGDHYTIHYMIPVGYFKASCISIKMFGMWSNSPLNYEIRHADTVTLTITASKLNKVDSEPIRVGSGETVYNYPNNELLATTEWEQIQYSQYYKNAQNIIQEYHNGVTDATIDVVCDDYYSNNILAKDWSNGEIFEVGDVVYIENSEKSSLFVPSVYRVTGREFSCKGVPKVKLELQQVAVQVEFYMPTYSLSDPTKGLLHSESVAYGNLIENVPDFQDSNFEGWKYDNEVLPLTVSEVKALRITRPYKFYAKFRNAG